MTVESNLFDALKGLVGNRVYPDIAPPGTACPYLTYQQSGGDVLTYADAVMPNLRNGRFQVSVWATTRAVAAALMRQAETALVESAVLTAEPLGGMVSRYDHETQHYGAFQFFSIWFE